MEVVGDGQDRGRGPRAVRRAAARRRGHRPADAGRHRSRRGPARCARTAADTGVVVLTMHSGDEQIFAAMEAGASAFVGKDAPSTEVVKAARHAAVSPRSFLCAGLTDAMLRRATAAATQLTSREHDVLKLLADGLERRRDRLADPPERVDRQVAPRQDLPEARRHQPRAGAGHRDAVRACCPACSPRSDSEHSDTASGYQRRSSHNGLSDSGRSSDLTTPPNPGDLWSWRSPGLSESKYQAKPRRHSNARLPAHHAQRPPRP